MKETQRDTGWSSLSAVGSFISKNHASVDPRNYGFGKLSDLVRKQQHYLEVKETTDAAGFTHLHIKLK